MSRKKQDRPIQPAELLPLLDLEEQQALAQKLGMTPPARLNDSAFSAGIAEFPITTLLRTIILLRYPLIEMLQEIYRFLAQESVRGRANVQAVVLPDDEDDFKLFFSPSLREALAIALDSRMISSLGTLETQIKDLNKLIMSQITSLQGAPVLSQTEISRRMREFWFDPEMQFLARSLDRMRIVYHPQDTKDVKMYYQDLKSFVQRFSEIIQTSGMDSSAAIQNATVLLQSLQGSEEAISRKIRDMESEQPGLYDLYEPDRKIGKLRWLALLEKTRKCKEELAAICLVQEWFSLLYDFLCLDLWHQSWRIYELWMLTHLLQLFMNLGFALDIHDRVIGDVWHFKFAKDGHPIGLLHGKDITLEVYYQLHTKRSDRGDMPDLAIKKHDGTFLLVCDPKYGKTYSQGNLEKVAMRYKEHFLADLTMIHNFYPVDTYDYNVFSHAPRGLIVSDIRPHSSNIAKIDREVRALVPATWLLGQRAVVLLVDASWSMSTLQERVKMAVEREGQQLLYDGITDGLLILFSSSMAESIPLIQIEAVREAFKHFPDGGTDLIGGIETALAKLNEKKVPRFLTLFSDGEDTFDIEAVQQMLDTAQVHLKIYEGRDSEGPSLLKRLAHLSGGEYHRI